MMVHILQLYPFWFLLIGIFQPEVAALPSIRGLTKNVPETDQETKPVAPQTNLDASRLKELSFAQFLDVLIEEVTDEQFLEALDIRYDKKYRHAFASVLQSSNSQDATARAGATHRVLRGGQFHRILFGVRCRVPEDCEADEVCKELTVDGVTANFCFRAGPPENQEAPEPLGDCASGDERMACTGVGATCTPMAITTTDGPQVVNRCRCREEDGYVTKPGTFMHPDIENIIASGNLDYYGCVQVDECSGANICPPADEGGICRDKDSSNGRYDCFCRRPSWVVAETDPVHGAIRCQDLDECEVFGDAICPDNSSCDNTIGGYTCTCDSGFLETEGGLCIAPAIVEESGACDPNFNNGDSCPENDRFCDAESARCLCIDGLFQAAGAGGQCSDRNECTLGLDFRCDKPRASCENLIPTVEEPLGYRCACLHGFVDVPNEVRGTNCIPVEVEVVATPAPVAAIAETPGPVPVVPVPPGPTPACQTAFASQCAIVPGEALCVNRAADGASGCICDFRQFYTAVGSSSFSNGDLACQLDECQQSNATICTALDPNTVCVDNDMGYNCPCADGFFLNSTSSLCQNIPCSDDTDCLLPTDPFPRSEQQRVCRQVLPTLMSAANTVNPLLNGCVCNVYNRDWGIQELQEIYCVRDTCRLDSIACPGPNEVCVNAPGTPGYTCVCDFAFGKATDGTCIDPCAALSCNDDQVCQRNPSTSLPPTAMCVDKNPCFENPCLNDPAGPFCVQDTANVTGYQCYCIQDGDCDQAYNPNTICFDGECSNTCDGECVADDRGEVCERDSLAVDGFFCYCNIDDDCDSTTTPGLTTCTTHNGDFDVCINPLSPCAENPCSSSPQGKECTPDLSGAPSFTCRCSTKSDCDSAGESNTVCEASTCTNPCDASPPVCLNNAAGDFCMPNFSVSTGFSCVCNDNDPSTSDNAYCDHLPNSFCGDEDVCQNICSDSNGVNQCANDVDGALCSLDGTTGFPDFTCGCEDRNQVTNNDQFCPPDRECDDGRDSFQDDGDEPLSDYDTGTGKCVPIPDVFVYTATSTTWDAHDAAAKAMGCELAAITSTEELNAAIAKIPQEQNVWIGGQHISGPIADYKDPGMATWEWSDSRFPWSFTAWGSTGTVPEPNGPAPPNTVQDGVRIRKDSNDVSLGWSDNPKFRDRPALYRCPGTRGTPAP